MEVTRYTFQSPSTSQVQVGKPDPAQQQEKATKKNTEELVKTTNTQLQSAQSYQTAQIQAQDVKPTVDANSANEIAVSASQEIKNENYKGTNGNGKANGINNENSSIEAKNENFKGANTNGNAKRNQNSEFVLDTYV